MSCVILLAEVIHVCLSKTIKRTAYDKVEHDRISCRRHFFNFLKKTLPTKELLGHSPYTLEMLLVNVF